MYIIAVTTTAVNSELAGLKESHLLQGVEHGAVHAKAEFCRLSTVKHRNQTMNYTQHIM